MERHASIRAIGLSVLLATSGAGCSAPSAGRATGTAAAGTEHPAERVELVIAATTDVHGRLRGWDYYEDRPDSARGLAAAATIVDSVRAAHPGRVVLVDGGDLLQGNPLTFVAARASPQGATGVHPVIAAMNAMRYDAAVVGNHEFNYGVPLLERAVGDARFPFLAANVVRSDGTAPFPAFAMIERQGVRIAIVGATTPGAMVWDRDNLAAAKFAVGDIVTSVRRSVNDVRGRGADVVIVLLHSGLAEPASYDTVATGLPSENVAGRIPREVDGVDAVVYGHSHRELTDSVVNGVLLMQPKNWAATVAVGTLTLARDGPRWRVVSRQGVAVPVAGHAESPAVLRATDGAHAATLAWIRQPIGRTAVVWRSDSARVVDTPIVDFMLETMRRAAGTDLAATAAFSLDAQLGPGDITLAQVSRLYPYDNTLRAVRISGAQLRAFLEHSARYYRTLDADGSVPRAGLVDAEVPGYNFDMVAGADYTVDLTKPAGARIVGLSYRGRPVAATDTFTMALNNYRQGGGGGFAMLAGAPVVFDREVDIRQLLIDEVRRAGVLDPARYATRNWRIVPERAVGIAYTEQRNASYLRSR